MAGNQRKQMLPIDRGHSAKPMISILINVAWGNEFLKSLLDILNIYQTKTTFFLQGSWVHRFPNEACQIKDEGHEIGSHAYTHPDMRELDIKQIESELNRSNKVFKKVLGIKPTLFSPPYGYWDQRVIEIAAQQGMSTILWSLDTLDWKLNHYQDILERILPKLSSGAFILMHPTASTIQALPLILNSAHERSYMIVPVSEMLGMSTDLSKINPIEGGSGGQ